jgi:flavin reductase (DIM6/NTAB) family NADH-FMN oxidoreductase RutF
MAIDSLQFRRAMGRLASGVTVLAAREADGGYIGMTASAFTSLSLDPPMVLACVGHAAVAHPALAAGESFSVSILAGDQEEVSRRFATRDFQRFDEPVAQRTPSGLPRVTGALAWLEVRRAAVYDVGDHAIVTGVVEWALARDGDPLVYYLGGYRRIAP